MNALVPKYLFGREPRGNNDGTSQKVTNVALSRRIFPSPYSLLFGLVGELISTSCLFHLPTRFLGHWGPRKVTRYLFHLPSCLLGHWGGRKVTRYLFHLPSCLLGHWGGRKATRKCLLLGRFGRLGILRVLVLLGIALDLFGADGQQEPVFRARKGKVSSDSSRRVGTIKASI